MDSPFIWNYLCNFKAFSAIYFKFIWDLGISKIRFSLKLLNACRQFENLISLKAIRSAKLKNKEIGSRKVKKSGELDGNNKHKLRLLLRFVWACLFSCLRLRRKIRWKSNSFVTDKNQSVTQWTFPTKFNLMKRNSSH